MGTLRFPAPILLLAGAAAPWLPGAVDPHSDPMVYWPRADAAAVERARQAGFQTMLAPLPAGAGFVRACGRAGITPIAWLAAADSVEQMRERAGRARAAGFRGIALDAEGALGAEAPLRAFLAEHAAFESIVFLDEARVGWNVAPAHAALRYGRWPGIAHQKITVASASQEPWIDSNAWVVAWLRAVFPQRAALLAYRPDEAAGVGPDRALDPRTLALVLAEARTLGGNTVLWLPDSFARSLAAGSRRAVEAWDEVARTVSFLRARRARFERPAASRTLVVAGTLEESAELLNMMFRRNVSPSIVRGDAIPALDPAVSPLLVSANLAEPPPEVRQRVAAFTFAGGRFFAAPAAEGARAWWLDPRARKLRSEEDREIYALGKGRVASYRAPVADTAEFALDILDEFGKRSSDLRIWNGQTVMGWRLARASGGVALVLVNYGSPREDMLIRVEGDYRKAVCERPGDDAPAALATVRRFGGTEITLDRIGRLAVINFE